MKTLGDKGEGLAAIYLQQHGYEIIERNWRTARGEIDIISKHEDSLVFVEVKTRKTYSRGAPEEAVTYRKQEKLRMLALSYIHQTGMTAAAYRFDVVSVNGRNREISIIKDAF